MMATARYLMVYSCCTRQHTKGRKKKKRKRERFSLRLSDELNPIPPFLAPSFSLQARLTARTRPPLRRKLGAKRAMTLNHPERYEKRCIGVRGRRKDKRGRRRVLSSLVSFSFPGTHITTPIPMMNLKVRERREISTVLHPLS